MKKAFLFFKRIVGIKYSRRDYEYVFVNDLKNDKRFSDISLNSGIISFLFNGYSRLYARIHPHSDMYVFKQIFEGLDYKIPIDFFTDNRLKNVGLNIIDAGANVGYTSIYFMSNFPKSKIVTIEPDKSNLKVLRKNLQSYIDKGEVFVYENALMDKSEQSMNIERGFRDGKDWSISVSVSTDEADLKSITIGQIMKERNWDRIDILKIDIEGAEKDVFKSGADVSYLQNVRMIAIEIHDEYNIRDDINSILRENGFLLFTSGETTYGLNKAMLNE